MSVIIVQNESQKQQAFQIRHTVFVEEQNVPEDIEMDEFDAEAIHFLCYDAGKPIGASRLRFVADVGKLERLCILKEYRGKSYGKQMIAKMEEEIKKHGYEKALLHAQVHAKAFYEQLGYRVVSEQFMDAGIPHVKMEKQL